MGGVDFGASSANLFSVSMSTERVEKVLEEEEDLAIDTRNEMQLYLANMDGRFNSSMKVSFHIPYKNMFNGSAFYLLFFFLLNL